MADSGGTPSAGIPIEGDVNVEFEEATSRQQLNSGESVKTLFGKLRKFLTDLKAVAFSGSYNDLSDVPTDSFVGDNLLDNPNFKINQRGVSGTVSAESPVIQENYFIDRWIIFDGSATINSDGTITLNGTIGQYLENAVGTDVVASASAGTAGYDDSFKLFSISASGEVISWAKLEHGSVATPFIAPDPVEELMKCQRYCVVVPSGRYFRASFVGTSVMQFLLPLPVSMVNVPSIVSGTMGVIPLNLSTAAQADTSFTFSFTGIKNNILTVQATKSNGAIDGALFVTEELVLSADL